MTPLVQLTEDVETVEQLTFDETIRLKQLEGEIEGCLRYFVVVGNALAEIRDTGLYRHYRNFEDYCDRRWQFARSTAYQFIDAATVVNNVRNCGQILPANEAQARALSVVRDPEQQREAWSRAVESAPDGRVTAKHVEETVRQYLGESTPSSEPVAWTLDDAVEHLGSKLYDISLRWPSAHLAIMAEQLRSLADELATYGELRP